jgi:ankyrin repeat protein
MGCASFGSVSFLLLLSVYTILGAEPALSYLSKFWGPPQVTLLLDYGANIEAKNRWGETPLISCLSAFYNEEDIARVLISRGANVNAKSLSGRTPLWYAAGYFPKLVQFLIDKGADINARDEHGETPFSQAEQHEHLGVVQLLRSKGADIYYPDQHDF